ncbi:mechanosensitive ion channel [Nitrincola iocasae]|uniref:Mechanosensitive ion channel n=2 Tax=Nitrincola iocasae TaxID=2614693 RepID=A0A5J6LE35_9GAMM|nr:mechanosensitive ion channel [Nitrincola iocasae]
MQVFMLTTHSMLIRPFLAFFLLLIASFSSPSFAQEADKATDTQPSSALLADLLENPETRDQLISELRALADPEKTQAAEEQQTSLVRQIADSTQAFAQQMTQQLLEALEVTSELANSDWHLMVPYALNFLYVIIATLLSYLVLRKLAIPLFRYADNLVSTRPGAARLVTRLVIVLGALLVDLLAILLAWVTGYSIALFLIGELGEMSTVQSLFLNAFLVIEVFKSLVRMFFSARYNGLRLLPFCAETAAYWNAWIAKISSFIGYGMLLLVPVVNFYAAPALGHVVSLLVMLTAFVYALAIILQNKKRVAENISEQAENSDFAFTKIILNMLSRSWHLLAIAYFAGLLLVTAIRPEDALPVILQASMQTLLAIVVGLFISALLTQVISRQVQVPDDLKARFPALQARLNEFIPTSLKFVRLIIMLVVFAFVLDAWSLFDFSAWLSSDTGSRLLGTVLSVAIILLIAKLTWIAFASWVEHRLSPTGRSIASARQQTLLKLLSNAVMIMLIVFTVMISLAELGLNIGPLIAGAGVVGLAIGFGAQTLVKDVITGIFIQLENAINTGDVVTADGITGTAENLTIRSLGLRDRFGTYHLIPFSSITTVSNYMRGYGYHVGDYGVAYREDTDDVTVHLRAAFDELMSDAEQSKDIMDELEVQGVSELADSAVNIRVRIKTLPGAQWSVGRAYNRLVKRHLDAASIEIPFPHFTLYFGQNKDGSAPPAPLNLVSTPASRNAEKSLEQQPDEARSNPQSGTDFDEA